MQLAKGVTFRNPLEEERMSREGKYRITDRIGEGGIPSGDYTRDEYDLQLRLLTLDPAVQDFFQYYVDQGHDPEKVMNILQRKYTDEDRKKEVQRYHGVIIHRPETQTSSAQYLIDQARKGAFDTDTLGVDVASAGNLRGSGIPGIVKRKWQAEKKLREDLGRDTSSQVPTYVDTAQVAAEPTGGGWQPDYSGAVADQQQQAAEAGQTHEQFMSDLDAVMAEGGLVSVNHLTRRL